MKALLLDLRGNHGGVLLSSDRRASTNWCPKGGLWPGRVAGLPWQTPTTTHQGCARWAACRIVVLIDHGTAAGAEIVAGALQDLDRGLVVGKDSFGLGLIENVFALDGGSHLRLAIARFSTPSGRVIQRPPSKAEKKYAEGGSGDTAPESPPTTRPAFKTAKGRTVYEVGASTPDVLLEEKPGLRGCRSR